MPIKSRKKQISSILDLLRWPMPINESPSSSGVGSIIKNAPIAVTRCRSLLFCKCESLRLILSFFASGLSSNAISSCRNFRINQSPKTEPIVAIRTSGRRLTLSATDSNRTIAGAARNVDTSIIPPIKPPKYRKCWKNSKITAIIAVSSSNIVKNATKIASRVCL